MTTTQIRKVDWSYISFPPGVLPSNCRIGRGSTCIVIRAIFKNTAGDVPVAIKVVTSSSADLINSSFEIESNRILQEAEIMKKVYDELNDNEFAIRLYAIVSGTLPDTICQAFNLREAEAIGIIMRLEEGGTLSDLLHKSVQIALPLDIKLKLLKDIARGISELHALGKYSHHVSVPYTTVCFCM